MTLPFANAHIVDRRTYGVLDVLGPTLELLTSPEETGAVYCVMMGTVPPGVSVPLHSHPDVESFYLISGAVQVLSQRENQFQWLDVKPGDFVHVPGGAKHAFRNTSSEQVVQLITTTPKLGRFFQEIGRPATTGVSPPPPTPDELEHFARVANKYGYWQAVRKKIERSGFRSLDLRRRSAVRGGLAMTGSGRRQ
jgi:quercetin dioxygenase-like cupin family protein